MNNEINDKTKKNVSVPQEVSPQVKSADVKEALKQEESSVVLNNVVESAGGINLVPLMSKADIVQEEKKSKLNMSSIVSIISFIVITILIVGFNIYTKMQLNTEKGNLEKKEEELYNYSSIITNNNEILARITLYKDIESDQYSSKGVVDYLNGLAVSSGGSTIDSFEFTSGYGLEFSGSSNNLEDVSKFWYLLANDANIKNVEMERLSKGNTVTFSFSGVIAVENF